MPIVTTKAAEILECISIMLSWQTVELPWPLNCARYSREEFVEAISWTRILISQEYSTTHTLAVDQGRQIITLTRIGP